MVLGMGVAPVSRYWAVRVVTQVLADREVSDCEPCAEG
jgi:hypothetical protein